MPPTVERVVLWTDDCESCGRWLVTVYDDGSCDIAGEAHVSASAKVPKGGIPSGGVVKAWPVRNSGVCHRCHPEAKSV